MSTPLSFLFVVSEAVSLQDEINHVVGRIHVEIIHRKIVCKRWMKVFWFVLMKDAWSFHLLFLRTTILRGVSKHLKLFL